MVGQLKLRDSRVLIVGCGGLGCPAAVYLAAAGVGTIGLVDDDLVELSNLHRQVAHSEASIGQSKVVSLGLRCKQINSTTNIEEFSVHLHSSNAVSIVNRFDVIVDCSDNLATRYLINDACAVCGPKPLVSGSALRLEGQMTVYLANRPLTKEEINANSPLPMENRAPCFRCLFPVPPPADTVQGCSEAGSSGCRLWSTCLLSRYMCHPLFVPINNSFFRLFVRGVPGMIGTMQAAEVIKILTGIGAVHSGRLLIVDLERNLTRTVVLRSPRPDCTVCGTMAQASPQSVALTDYVLFCGAPAHDKLTNFILFCFPPAPQCQSPASEKSDHSPGTISYQVAHCVFVFYQFVVYGYFSSSQQLHDWMQTGEPHILIDLRPQVEVELCRLTPCLYFPMKILLRDSVLGEIQAALDEKLKLSAKRPIPIVLLCHRGNKSQIAATQLASALLAFRHRNPLTALPTTDLVDVGATNGNNGEDGQQTNFVICDVAGGLSAWAAEIDPQFPVY
ncbi:adenylyltransferase and sulfurtransferase [Paragonimus westermani]|uniref:Adenylyltransferase and sulfurtransferase n=1 Tax=Paragonimus westermani TaxID=34504 RepID=A0A5J4NAQ2_9TREM|nr:adenylyltransferase and sulfurtransferase [Paragonimus westermani]